jgi:hypothetical protein
MAIASEPWKNRGGYRQYAEAELIFILVDKCNFSGQKIRGYRQTIFFHKLYIS